ncbi:MAG: DsbA family protein [Hyphomicrobiales bacterium]
MSTLASRKIKSDTHQPTRRRVTTALAGGIGLAATSALGWPGAGARAQGNDASRKRHQALMQPTELKDMAVGDANAPITIIEYASMTCPHCASFHTTTYPQLKKKYLDTGKARLIFRDYPLGNLAVAAAMLARCADEAIYFPFIEALFRQQSTWATQNPVAPLKKLAKQVGITDEGFDKCLSNQVILDGIREVATRANKQFGVDSTPTFFIN